MTTLFRPVGLKEMLLIRDADYRAFPPRLPEQPIFYPVLNREYAAQIAERWNTVDEVSGFCGFVTRFEVNGDYLFRFEEKVVGAEGLHRELWVPAEELEEFNSKIQGKIGIVDAFFGKRFSERGSLGLLAGAWEEPPPPFI